MGNKLVHFLAKSTKVPKMGANMDLKQYPFSLLIPDTKTEPLMAIITATLLSKPSGVDGPLHDQTIEPFVCPADDVTDVCG